MANKAVPKFLILEFSDSVVTINVCSTCTRGKGYLPLIAHNITLIWYFLIKGSIKSYERILCIKMISIFFKQINTKQAF